MKKIAMIGTLLLISIFSITYVWASVEENCNVSLQTDKTEISKTQEQVKITISLDSYDGDGTLGYEGKLEYDTNIFESATITSLNDWETANYETTTGMFLSTTTSAKAGTQVAQITLDLKENVTAISTQVKITGLTFSDGDTQKTFEETFDYSFPYNKAEEQPDTNPDMDNENTNEATNQITNSTINIVTNQMVNETINTGERNIIVQNITVESITTTNRDQSTATTTIPQTGSGLGWMIALIVIGIIGVGAYIRYRSIPLK